MYSRNSVYISSYYWTVRVRIRVRVRLVEARQLSLLPRGGSTHSVALLYVPNIITYMELQWNLLGLHWPAHLFWRYKQVTNPLQLNLYSDISIITCKTRVMAPQKRRKTLVKAVLGQVREIDGMKTRHVVIECAKSTHHWWSAWPMNFDFIMC